LMAANVIENQFWLGLWAALIEEWKFPRDEAAPIDQQWTSVCERLAQRVERDGDWYRVAGVENLKPMPNDVGIDVLMFATLFGNYLAWRSGIKFFDRVKPSQ